MKYLKKNDLIRTRKLFNLFIFIHNLNMINDGGEFEKNYKDVYPE